MTREEAISIISGYEVYGCGYCLTGGDEVEEALRLAVDALRKEAVIRCKDCKKRAFGRWCGNYPTFQPEVSDDHYCGYAERRTE